MLLNPDLPFHEVLEEHFETDCTKNESIVDRFYKTGDFRELFE